MVCAVEVLDFAESSVGEASHEAEAFVGDLVCCGGWKDWSGVFEDESVVCCWVHDRVWQRSARCYMISIHWSDPVLSSLISVSSKSMYRSSSSNSRPL